MAVRVLPPPVLLLALLLALVASVAHGGDGKLKVGFYKDSCPDAEAIVRRIVAKAVRKDPTANAPLLRLHFHDCFVRVSALLSSLRIPSVSFDCRDALGCSADELS